MIRARRSAASSVRATPASVAMERISCTRSRRLITSGPAATAARAKASIVYSRWEKGRLWSVAVRSGRRLATTVDLNRRAVSAVTCRRYPKRWVNQRSSVCSYRPDEAEGLRITLRAYERVGNEASGRGAYFKRSCQVGAPARSGRSSATTLTTISLITNRPSGQSTTVSAPATRRTSHRTPRRVALRTPVPI